MIRIGLAVEGDTELRFLRDVVAPHYHYRICHLEPIDMEGKVGVDLLTSLMLRDTLIRPLDCGVSSPSRCKQGERSGEPARMR